MRYRVEFFFFQILKLFVLALPLKSAQRLGYHLGGFGYRVFGRRRRIALENLRYAFPAMSDSDCATIARGAFRNYGVSIVELLWFPNLDDTHIRRLVAFRNLEVMIEGQRKGKGLVMLSGHFGNWELCALSAAHVAGLPVTIIVQRQGNRYVDEVINRHRCLFGNRVIPMGISIREIIRTLNDGGIVAIAPDQSGPVEGVYVDFFGRHVATHQGPAVFSLRTGAPLQIGFLVRQPDWSYEFILEEVPSSDLIGYNEENIRELTRRHTLVLEKYIRMHPDHWLWMHRRWKHTNTAVEPVDHAGSIS